MSSDTKFLIREPFTGVAQSYLRPDGIVAFTNGLTVEEYERENNFKTRIVTGEELDAMIVAHFTTDPKPVDEDRWHEMLGMLPPCRWGNVGQFEVFHMSEAICSNMVTWFASLDGDVVRCWEFVDQASITKADLAAKLKKAAAEGA